MDTVFRSLPALNTDDTPVVSEFKENKQGAETSLTDSEPISSDSTDLLNILGISDDLANLDSTSLENLNEIKGYLKTLMDKKGLEATRGSLSKVFNDLKSEMEFDSEASADFVIEKVGNLIKAYKDLAFIKDPREKRALFMKLARQENSKDMHRLVFETYEKNKVWQ